MMIGINLSHPHLFPPPPLYLSRLAILVTTKSTFIKQLPPHTHTHTHTHEIETTIFFYHDFFSQLIVLHCPTALCIIIIQTLPSHLIHFNCFNFIYSNAILNFFQLSSQLSTLLAIMDHLIPAYQLSILIDHSATLCVL